MHTRVIKLTTHKPAPPATPEEHPWKGELSVSLEIDGRAIPGFQAMSMGTSIDDVVNEVELVLIVDKIEIVDTQEE